MKRGSRAALHKDAGTCCPREALRLICFPWFMGCRLSQLHHRSSETRKASTGKGAVRKRYRAEAWVTWSACRAFHVSHGRVKSLGL